MCVWENWGACLSGITGLCNASLYPLATQTTKPRSATRTGGGQGWERAWKQQTWPPAAFYMWSSPVCTGPGLQGSHAPSAEGNLQQHVGAVTELVPLCKWVSANLKGCSGAQGRSCMQFDFIHFSESKSQDFTSNYWSPFYPVHFQ